MPNRFNDALPEDDKRTDGKAECHECHQLDNADDMAELNGWYFCSRCFDPQNAAHGYIVTMVDHMAAEIQGLKAERRKLTAEINMMRRKAA